MQPEDQDIELWARQLAGDPSAGTSPEIDKLREAIRARGEAINAAAAVDDLARVRFMKRLEQEGLLTDEKRSWQPWIGAAAAVLIAIVGVSFIRLPEVGGSGERYRGISGSITIVNEQPEKEAEEALEQLRALGFQPRRLDRGDRIIIEIEVASEKLEAFQTWAAGNGRVLQPGVYRVFVTPKERGD